MACGHAGIMCRGGFPVPAAECSSQRLRMADLAFFRVNGDAGDSRALEHNRLRSVRHRSVEAALLQSRSRRQTRQGPIKTAHLGQLEARRSRYVPPSFHRSGGDARLTRPDTMSGADALACALRRGNSALARLCRLCGLFRDRHASCATHYRFSGGSRARTGVAADR